MQAHIVGGGFGGLAAAAYLIRNAGVPGFDITIYEADARPGGGFFLGGNAQSGYSLPGSVFDAEFRCTFDLLADIPSTRDPSVSVKDEFFTFNAQNPFHDRAHILDREGQILHGPHYGLSLRHGLDLVKLSLTPEALLDGRRIEEVFPADFFQTEFWLLWSTIMGSLPQHGATEFRRYINRALGLFPDLSDMRHILRTPICQYQAFIEPLAAWLLARGVKLLTGTFVRDLGLAAARDRITVERLDCERNGVVAPVAVRPEDIVLLTTGSQAADLSTGSMTEPPPKRRGNASWALWQRLAEARPGFGDPELFFGDAAVSDSRWVTFTVTTTGDEFIDRMTALTGSEPGRGGLVTLKDFGLGIVALDLPPARGHRAAGRHQALVGLRTVSRTDRRFRAQAYGRVHRGGDPAGGAAAVALRPAVRRHHGVLDLHPLRHALCKQYLDAAAPHGPSPPGPGRVHQSRPDWPVCRSWAGRGVHH